MWERVGSQAQLVIRSLRSPRAILASLAGNSLIWRGLPDLIETGLLRVFDLLIEYLPLITAAIAGTIAVDLALVGLGFEWLLFTYLIYRLTPRLLPTHDPAAAVFDTREFKLLVILLVIALAQPIAAVVPVAFAPSLPTIPVGPGQLLLGWIVGGWAVTSSYIYFRWWRGASVTDRLEFADQITGKRMESDQREKLHEQLSRSDWVRPVTNFNYVFASGGKVMIICFLFGMVAGFASMLFPLAEVVVLVGAVTGVLTDRLPEQLTRGKISSLHNRTGDIEQRFYLLLQYTTTSRKGTFVALFVITGFVLSMFLILVSLIGLIAFVMVAFQLLGQASMATRIPVRLWNGIGYLLCLATPGLYSLWFWIRETFRVPHFLAHWEDMKPGAAEIETADDLPRLVTRPPYFLLPPTVLWIPVVVVMQVMGEGKPIAFDNPLFALGWPLLFGGVLWTVRWTLRNEPQPPSTEGLALPAVLLVQVGWLGILNRLLPEDIRVFQLPTLALIASLMLVLYYAPDIRVYLDHTDRVPDDYTLLVGGVTMSGVLLILASLMAVFGSNSSGFILQLGMIGGGFLLAWSVVGHVLTQFAKDS